MWKDKRLPIEFGKQRGEVPFWNVGFHDFGSRGVELHEIATPEFMKAENMKHMSGKGQVI
jgi:hypothetical protein